jgi:hypothetical protein
LLFVALPLHLKAGVGREERVFAQRTHANKAITWETVTGQKISVEVFDPSNNWPHCKADAR